MLKKILRLPEVRERLGVGRTTLYERFVPTGRLRPCRSDRAPSVSLRATSMPSSTSLSPSATRRAGTLHEEQTFEARARGQTSRGMRAGLVRYENAHR